MLPVLKLLDDGNTALTFTKPGNYRDIADLLRKHGAKE
jgi:hypothetical protein